MRKIIGAFLGLALFLVVASPTQAADNCKVVRTGANSRNICRIQVTKSFNLTVNNDAKNNSLTITSTANTGGNSVVNNTGGGTIKTGDVKVDIKIVTKLNETVVNIKQ